MPGAEGTLVGRGQELADLAAALDALRSPPARWVAVSGEPGSGKTRLLTELCERAAERDCLVLVGRGAELERELPFGVWVSALDDHAAALGAERLERLVGERTAELAQVLPSIAPGGALSGGLQDERYRAHRAVRALLVALAARRPLVLVLDDLHWADDASLELVAHLLRRPARARILCALAFREGHLAPSVLAALRDSGVITLRPGPLSARDADALIGPELPAAVRREVYAQSGGNPFYLRELARVARDARVPASISAALGQEIGGLGEAARALAFGAAVAGDPAELDVATVAAGLDEPTALATLDELVARDVLRPTAAARRYAFRHPIVRRAVYEAAGEGWRLAAHARVAGALAGRAGTLAARAHHVERSARVGDEAAVALLETAARSAAARAPAVAAGWLSAALRLLPATGAGRRLELLAELAPALAATGRVTEALAVVQDALALVPDDAKALRVRLIAACASLENTLGRHGAAHARLLHALAELPGEEAALQVELAADALYDSDFAAMQSWATRAVETAAEPAVAAVAQALLCFAEYGLGRPGPAEAARATAAAALDALPDELLATRLDLPNYLGYGEYFCERYEDAARHFRRGIALARAVGQGQFFVPMLVGLAQALERLGRLREALETAEAAVDASRLSGNPQAVGFALVAAAWTATELGDVDHARAAAEEALGALAALDESVLTVATHAHVGVIWLEIGEPERCLEQLRAAGLPGLPLIEPGRRGWLHTVAARAELACGRASAAAGWAERADATVAGLGLPLAEAWVLHARALLALDAGDARGAAALAEQAAARADAVAAPVPAARCRTLAGVALGAAGDRERAVELLTLAERELAACEAHRARDEAARHLRRLGLRVGARQRRFAPATGLEALSGREREIAERVASGATNREIAGQLFLSARTVESHLTSVFAKLGVSSRAEVARLIGSSREL